MKPATKDKAGKTDEVRMFGVRISVPDRDYARLKVEAARRGVSIAGCCVVLIHEGLKGKR